MLHQIAITHYLQDKLPSENRSYKKRVKRNFRLTPKTLPKSKGKVFKTNKHTTKYIKKRREKEKKGELHKTLGNRQFLWIHSDSMF